MPVNVDSFEDLPAAIHERVRALWERDRLSVPEIAETVGLPIEWVRRITEEERPRQGGRRTGRAWTVPLPSIQ
jgi:hypothetical protein